MFDDLPEDLRKFLKKLEKDNVIEFNNDLTAIRTRDIALFQKGLTNFKSPNHISEIIKINLLNYFSRTESSYFYFPIEISETIIISTGEEKVKDEKKEGYNGGSPPHPTQNGDREVKVYDYKDLSEVPFFMVAPYVEKRKEELGIWISKIAYRHFGNLSCLFGDSDPVFSKIESHFKAKYDGQGWFTAIDKNKKQQLRLCFTLQFHDHGRLRIHLKRGIDQELFLSQFFKIFDFMDQEDLNHFIELLRVEQYDNPAFKIHSIRRVGPKETVDEDFKGALVKVNEVHWFGEKKYDVRICYSMDPKPHIEGEGPAPQVENLLSVVSGPIDYVANLTDIRELGYRTRDKVHDNYVGIGKLSENLNGRNQMLQVLESDIQNYQQEMLVEFSELQAWQFKKDIQDELYVIEFRDYVKKLTHLGKNLSERINALSVSDTEKTKYLQDLSRAFNEVVSSFDMIPHEISEFIHDNVEPLVTGQQSISKKIEAVESKIDEYNEKIIQKFEDLMEFLSKNFTEIKKERRNFLYLILKNINRNRDLTIKKLMEETHLPRQTLVGYLQKLQNKGLLKVGILRTGKRGRPPKLFTSTKKLKNLFKN